MRTAVRWDGRRAEDGGEAVAAADTRRPGAASSLLALPSRLGPSTPIMTSPAPRNQEGGGLCPPPVRADGALAHQTIGGLPLIRESLRPW